MEKDIAKSPAIGVNSTAVPYANEDNCQSVLCDEMVVGIDGEDLHIASWDFEKGRGWYMSNTVLADESKTNLMGLKSGSHSNVGEWNVVCPYRGMKAWHLFQLW